LSAAEIDETVGSFQNFISATQQICFWGRFPKEPICMSDITR
jgi:hypothetical protein